VVPQFGHTVDVVVKIAVAMRVVFVCVLVVLQQLLWQAAEGNRLS
jgi:hypothetical protein